MFCLFVCLFCDCLLQLSVFKVKINITSLRALIITVIALYLLLTIPMGSHSSIKKHKPFKSLNHLILCILLVFHLGVMGCEICTMMRKQLTSTPVVYVYCTDEGPAGAIILIHSMVSTRGAIRGDLMTLNYTFICITWLVLCPLVGMILASHLKNHVFFFFLTHFLKFF